VAETTKGAVTDLPLDVDAAYTAYLDRFEKRFGSRALGSFAKFGRTMVQKLDRSQFEDRLRRYLEMHSACKKMLASGATISDAVVLEFEESAAWIVLQPPDLMKMFRGELGES